jgi:hypothetical protein
MMPKVRPFGKYEITNTWKVLKRGAGERRRRSFGTNACGMK